MTKNSRNAAIDTLKGILILLVVVGHCGQPPTGPDLRTLQEIIYCFHMPAFFVLSALFVKDDPKKEIKGMKFLLSTFVIWTLIGFRKNPGGIPGALAFGNWEFLQSPLWFLPAIMVFKALISVNLNPNRRWLQILSLVLAVLALGFKDLIQSWHSHIPWGFDIALAMLPFAFLARGFFRSEFLQKLETKPLPLLFVSLITFAASLTLFFLRVEVNHATAYARQLDLAQYSLPGPEGLLYLALMILSLIAICRVKMKANLFSWLGERSMLIFLMHLMLMGKMEGLMGLHPYAFVLVIAITTLVPAVAAHVLIKFDKRFRYLGA